MSLRTWIVDGLEWIYNRATGRRPDLAGEVAVRLGAHRPGDFLLDLGAGDGRVGAAVGAATRGRVILCDRNEAKLRDRPPGAWAVLADAAALPFAPGTFAGAFLVDVLHHLPTPEAAMRELVRVLGPGAAMVILDYRPESSLSRLLSRLRPLVCATCHFRGPAEVRSLLVAAGLHAVCEPVDRHEYACVGTRRGMRAHARALPAR